MSIESLDDSDKAAKLQAPTIENNLKSCMLHMCSLNQAQTTKSIAF